MFNSVHGSVPLLDLNVLMGKTQEDHGQTILYAGFDPADSKRILIRKLLRVNVSTYCLEETRLTPVEGKKEALLHRHLYRIKGFDIQEHITPEELQIRGAFRPIPNVMGFSLFMNN